MNLPIMFRHCFIFVTRGVSIGGIPHVLTKSVMQGTAALTNVILLTDRPSDDVHGTLDSTVDTPTISLQWL